MARWDEVEEEADPVRNGWTECVGIYKSCRSEIGERLHWIEEYGTEYREKPRST